MEASHGFAGPCTLPRRPSPPVGGPSPGPAPRRPRLRSRQPRRPLPAFVVGRAAGPSGGPHGAVRGGGPDSLEPGAGPAPLPACRAQVWPRRGRGCAFLPARPFLTHPGRMQPPPGPPQPPPPPPVARPGIVEGIECWESGAGREPQAPPASGTHCL